MDHWNRSHHIKMLKARSKLAKNLEFRRQSQLQIANIAIWPHPKNKNLQACNMCIKYKRLKFDYLISYITCFIVLTVCKEFMVWNISSEVAKIC